MLGFLAGVERVVDGFLHRRQEGLPRVVEPEKVSVLGEELRDRNVSLLPRHRFGCVFALTHGAVGSPPTRSGDGTRPMPVAAVRPPRFPDRPMAGKRRASINRAEDEGEAARGTPQP
jgi:hypothetical protein